MASRLHIKARRWPYATFSRYKEPRGFAWLSKHVMATRSGMIPRVHGRLTEVHSIALRGDSSVHRRMASRHGGIWNLRVDGAKEYA
jgi:hypothetical protein